MLERPAFNRSRFLQASAGLVVACGIPAPLRAAVATGEAHAPFPAVSPASLDSWLAIMPDGSVTGFTGRNDSGQGKETAFAQVIAEELDVRVSTVLMVMGDTARTNDQGGSFASDGLLDGARPLRHAAAEARAFLLRLASTRLNVPVEQLRTHDGAVLVAAVSSRRITYAGLVGGRRFDVKLNVTGSGRSLDIIGTVPVKDPKTYTIVGTSVPRFDIPAKVSGTYARVQNVRLPGMLHGRLVPPPAYGAEVVRFGGLKEPIDGVIKVVRKDNFVAVVARDEWTAIRGARSVDVTWSTPQHLVTGDLFDAMRKMPANAPVRAVPLEGDVEAALAVAQTKLQATYDFPIQNHGMMGPSCAVADVRPGEVTLYSGTQYPVITRRNVAAMLGVPLESVRVIWHQTAGCYGRMTMDDSVSAAALLSQAVGAPVRVQFMREDEHAWEPHIAPYTFAMRAGMDANGHVTVWDQDVWTWGLGPQAELPWILSGTAPPNPGRFSFAKIGGGDAPTYKFANQRSTGHPITTPMVRSIDMRSPGYIQANFANESFVDELAAKAGKDPIQFRLEHALEGRAVDVLHAVERLSKWERRPSPSAAARGSGRIARGRGVAVVSGQKSTWVATVAEVEVDRLTGVVRPTRMFVAVDAGLIVNPDGLRNQIEGATLFGTSRALKEELTWNASAVTSTNWANYPILRFTDVPDVEIVTIDRIEQPPGGIGEPPNTTAPAAIGNAVFDATGVRLRRVPFTSTRVKLALEERSRS